MATQSIGDKLSDDYILINDQNVEESNGKFYQNHTTLCSLPLTSREVSAETTAQLQAWLCPTDYSSDSGDLKKHLAARTAGTCHWLHERQAFREWYTSPVKSLLWLEGIPGSGKSVVTSSLIEHLSLDVTPVLYFFIRRTIDCNKSPASLIRDWLSQLLPYSDTLAGELGNEMTRHPSISTLTFDVLWQIFISAVSAMKKVYCIIEGLDELAPGNEDFYARINELAHTKPSAIKIVVATRQLAAAEQALTTDLRTKIKLNRHNTEGDIAMFVKARLQTFDVLELDEGARGQLCKTICTVSNGLFLYARLAIDELSEKGYELGKEYLKSALSDLPKGVENMYASILNEQRLRTGVSLERQLTILRWVTHATRPLRLIELANVLNIPNGESAVHASQAEAKAEVRRSCGPLLEVLPDETVQAIHYSLTEYLTDQRRAEDTPGADLTYPVIGHDHAHYVISETCIEYLSFRCFLSPWGTESDSFDREDNDSRFAGDKISLKNEWRERSRSFPFLEYAANHWTTHVKMYGKLDDELFEALDSFLLNEPQLLQNWLDFVWLPHNEWHHVSGDFKALHVAAFFGLTSYAEHLLGMDECAALAETTENRNSLSYAAQMGHTAIVALFLKHSNPNAHCNLGLTPLDYAAQFGHASTVRLLLHAGVDPVAATMRCDRPGSCPCSWKKLKAKKSLRLAIQNGKTQVVQELLDYMSPDDLKQIGVDSTPLHWAAKHGRAEIATILLDRGRINVDCKDRHGHTPLYKAVNSGSAAVVKVLLGHGADHGLMFRPKCSWSNDPLPEISLLHACMDRQKSYSPDRALAADLMSMASELLEAGIDVNVRDSTGKTPLHNASAAFGNSQMIELLLQHGANPSSSDNMGNEPLHISTPGNIPILVAAGANPNARRKDGKTPLLASLSSLYWDHTQLVKALVESGADVNLQDGDGNSALMLSMPECYNSVFGLLLESGADPNTRNGQGKGILHELHDRGPLLECQAMEKLLKERQIDIDTQDNTGETALFFSALRGDTKKVSMLLDAGADMHVRDFEGRSLLHASVGSVPGEFPEVNQFHDCRDKVSILQRFLALGLDASTADFQGNTALVELANADWNTSDLPLYKPENRHRLEAIEILVSSGASPFHKNAEDQTCLHLCASNVDRMLKNGQCTPNIVGKNLPIHALLKLGFDLGDKDRNGNTALHTAAFVNRASGRIAEYHVSPLLDAGADPTSMNNDLKTPLHLAAEAGQCSSVEILVKAMGSSQSLDHQDSRGKTALHYAACAGRLASVRSLLRAGANYSTKDAEGKLPLHVAATYVSDEASSLAPVEPHQHHDIILELLAAGADADEKDSSGMTPRGIATALGIEHVDETFMQLEPTGLRHRPDYKKNVLLKLRNTYKIPTKSIKAMIQGKDINRLTGLLCDAAKRWDHITFDALLNWKPEVLFSCPENPTYSLDVGPPFHIMALSGWERMMRRYLSKDSVHKVGESKQTLLHYAVKSEVNNLDMLKLLVEYGIDVNARADYPPDQSEVPALGPTALHYLASSGHYWYIEALEYLASVGGDISMENGFGSDCLQIAVKRGGFWRHEMVATLLKLGADPKTADDMGRTVLSSAVTEGDMVMVRTLLDHGVDVNQGNETPLHAAVRCRNVEMVKLLLDEGAKVGDTPKSEWEYGQYHHYVSVLAACSESVGAFSAIAPGKVSDIYDLLICNGANIDEKADDGCALMHWLAERNSHVAYMIKAGANIECLNSKGQTPLLVACDAGKGRPEDGFDIAALELLKGGANATVVDQSGKNALHLLLERTDHWAESTEEPVRVVQALLDVGCSPSARDNEGRTPLHVALKTGKFTYAAMLVEAGADILALDPDGNSALHHTAHFASRYPFRKSRDQRSDPAPFFTRWLQAGVDINGENTAGATPVFLAVEGEFTNETLELYLSAGADLTHRDNDGQGLLHVVAKGSKGLCRDLLEGQCLCRCGCSDEDSDGVFEAAKFKLLLEAGLNPRFEDDRQRTPLDLAAASGLSEILNMFVE
ncbi:hypothetical protein H2200_003693 [Cladophialophora chaetospira]|uniref:NACHT domain-containing protein n=1 Tax=Cladophialophora chaetospira TaxID=386627 RepID=A0AA38XEP1_9EURO|nr:hypothetical protein H2200_003693 [Cladophialophora chaetospira]